MIAPLIRDGRLRSTLNVTHTSTRWWTAEDLVLIADVAERTWDALERARTEEALRKPNRLKDEFPAMLAHELRNPLAPHFQRGRYVAPNWRPATVRCTHRTATIVALTGYGQPRDRALSEAAGFDHHFVKPVAHEELPRILSSLSHRGAGPAGTA